MNAINFLELRMKKHPCNCTFSFFEQQLHTLNSDLFLFCSALVLFESVPKFQHAIIIFLDFLKCLEFARYSKEI